jgi:hypothetical protein
MILCVYSSDIRSRGDWAVLLLSSSDLSSKYVGLHCPEGLYSV